MQNYYKAYMREKQARDELEELLEEKTSKLYALNVELEKKIEILQKQQVAVVESEKMATLGTLSAGVAHEINNPLAYLTCNLDTLSEYTNDIGKYLVLSSKLIDNDINISEFSGEITKLQNSISTSDLIQDVNDITDDCKEGCERISKIVANLLDFAKPKIEAIVEFEALEVIEQTTQLLENKLKQLRVTIDCKAELIIKGNKSNLIQALVNILVNAAQSCNSKKSTEPTFIPKLTITAKQEGQTAVFEVKDNGQGIDPKIISRVFDPFYSTKPLGEGTGMGLAVVYGIISNHGGTVSIDNNLDAGATVTIKIPLVN
ncbi:ATP-binding protein [Pseudoalteromonas luteoviolacea]|uniref:sensor histidine kinase n=1 Tax=Pseudoalteromonas luteoviolacea TaxID=43657 RepID=UPI001F275315|nr:ATP-binding protein [Pseudoalteromonas luteoviolacea]MCF6442782.1 ATP-binding protein [Pseudoalteromonas luteoviolacea]